MRQKGAGIKNTVYLGKLSLDVDAPSRDSSLLSYKPPSPSSGPRSSTEITCNFNRLNILLLRSSTSSSDGLPAAKKIATTTITGARIEATLGKHNYISCGTVCLLGAFQILLKFTVSYYTNTFIEMQCGEKIRDYSTLALNKVLLKKIVQSKIT